MTGIFFSSLPCAINTAAGVACGVVALLCCVAAGWGVLFVCTAGYFYPLLKSPKEQHLYKPRATFVQALNMYRFDRKLRLLFFTEIEKIEVAICSCITNAVSEYFNDLFWITNPTYFFNMQSFRYTQDTIDAELKKSKEDFILHFRSAYTDDYPPAWMITLQDLHEPER